MHELLGRDDHRRSERDQEVDPAREQQAGEEREWKRALRILCFFCDVRGVLESNERVERERGASDDGEERARSVCELEVAADVGVAAALGVGGPADRSPESDRADSQA
jgi:hypothetical protein